MRILLTTDTIGGVWTFTSQLSGELLRRGHEVYLVSLGRDLSPGQNDWCREQGRRFGERFTVRVTAIPLEWMQNNEAAFEEGHEELLDSVARFRPDLILSSQFCFGRLDTTIPRIVIAHSDVLSWAKACRPSALEPSPWLNRYTSMVQAGLLDAIAVVAPTEWMGKALATSFFLPGDSVVIPNGASAEPARYPAPARKFQAITAGRLWDEAKGLDTLQDFDSPMPLLVAGDNTFESPDPRVRWPDGLISLGPLSPAELHQKFRESDVYLCTSRYEPFGLAPLEAALCGCLLVMRDLPSLREVWDDAALYFTDNASLTWILKSLGRDSTLLAEARSRAHRRALRYTPERMADSYLQLFESVLQKAQSKHVA